MLATLSLCLILNAPPPVTVIAYSPDGKILLAGTRGEVHRFDAATGDRLSLISNLTNRITAIAFQDTKTFAVAHGEPGKSGVINLYSDGKLRHSTPAHSDSIFAIAFTLDGKSLYTGGYDRILKKWDITAEALKLSAELKDHSDTITAMAMHPKGHLLATASVDRTVKLWDTTTNQRLYSLGDSTDWLATVAWSPEGKRLTAAGTDKSIRTWLADAKAGSLERSVFAHGGPVVKLAYSADGQSIVSVGEDKLVKVWNAMTLKETFTTKPLKDSVHSLALPSDAKTVAIASFDGSLVSLDTKTGTVAQKYLPYLPKPGTIASVSPMFAARNSKTRVTLTGRGLDQTTGVKAIDNVKFTLLDKSQDKVTIDIDTTKRSPLGNLSLVLESPIGPSNAISLTIERFPELAETGKTDSITTAMAVPLNRTLTGTLDRAGDVDYFRFQAKAGEQIGIGIVGPKFLPLMTILGPKQEKLEESTSSALGFICPADGLYTLAIRDRDFRGGSEFTYRVSLGDVPVIIAPFPAIVQRGQTTDVKLFGVNLPKSDGLKVMPDDKAMTVDLVPMLKMDDKPLGNATVRVDDLPAQTTTAREVKLTTTPTAVDGVIAKPGDDLSVLFNAKKGERLIVEGLAQRFGSPVDPQIEILNANGQPVPRAVLRCVAKTILTFRDHDSTKPGLRLETWNELATNDLLLIDNEIVKIQQLPGHPDADCDFFDFNGARMAFFDTTSAHHAKDSTMYKIELHPPGTTFPPNGMPVVRLDYRNDDGGPGYGKDARLIFIAPADGEYRVRVSDSRGHGGPSHLVRVTVRPPKPDFKVKVTPTKPTVWKNGAIPVGVSIERLDGYDGPVELTMTNLPAGFSSKPGMIEAGSFFNTTLSLAASKDAKDAKTPITLVAKAANGIEHTVEISPPAIEAKTELTMQLNAESLKIVPGQETRFQVKIERLNGFKNRVPLEVRALPHGVTVQNIGLNKIMITEKETEREIVLRAESWVEPMTVQLTVVAIREGKSQPYAAPAVLLTVGP